MNRFLMTIAGAVGLSVAAVCWGDDLQNRQLLETLPRDRRASLAANLDRFDRLSGSEQASIRRLDATISAIDPVEQARYRSLLHHYHLWLQGLSIEQRDQLLTLSNLDERFALARKFRLAERLRSRRDGPRIAHIRTGDFGLVGPYEGAYLLKVWREISPEKRTDLQTMPTARICEELRTQAKLLKIRFDRFSTDKEKIYAEKLENDQEFKPILEPLLHRMEQALKKLDAAKKVDAAQKRFEHPFAEFLFFEENRPGPVDPNRLERFADSCPEWFHSVTDSLSADDARDYYGILYRLTYPSPNEMPELVKPIKPPTEPAVKRTAKPKPDAGSSPF